VPDGGLFRAARFRDVHLYGGFAHSVFDGAVPYRDFFMEYPPGALAVFLPPEVFGSAHYNAAFKTLMTLCGAVTIAVVALLLVHLGATRARLWAALALLALSPIALGPISLNTYDAWPALLTVVALALLAAAAPHGLLESFRAQAGRSLQVESLGGSLLGVADRLGWYSATVVHRTSHTISYDLVGSLPRAIGVVSSVLQVLAVVGVTLLYLRRRDDLVRLAAAFAAVVAGFLAFTRFFSPQYLVWLIPLVVLLQPLEWMLTAAALVLAQVWFFHYGDVFSLGGHIWLVALRDLIVVALFVVLLRRCAVEDEHTVLLEDEAPVRVPS
jgi:hypothetical protein